MKALTRSEVEGFKEHRQLLDDTWDRVFALLDERDSLRAERDELKVKNDQAAVEIYTTHHERDSLRAERDELKEHNSRLKQACDIFEKNSADACDLEKERNALKAENERLFKTLERIAVGMCLRFGVGRGSADACDCCQDAGGAAHECRAALAAKEGR